MGRCAQNPDARENTAFLSFFLLSLLNGFLFKISRSVIVCHLPALICFCAFCLCAFCFCTFSAGAHGSRLSVQRFGVRTLLAGKIWLIPVPVSFLHAFARRGPFRRKSGDGDDQAKSIFRLGRL
ncbi:MAG: hypothetical protein HDT27_03705 [Subdoligranulum sp.]|nr:hypothetical protein [Subdoligranulum sp.]